MQEKLKGIIPAAISPFTSSDELDERKTRENVDFLISEGVNAVLVNGGTGEFPALSAAERNRVIDVSVDAANGRVPIIVGSLSPGIGDSIEQIKYAKNAGADVVLQVTPYYFSQLQDRSIYEYFETLASKIDMPILLYNIPYRTSNNLSPDVISKLARIDNIIGIKQSNREMSQTYELNMILETTRKKFAILSGEDDLFYPLITLGMCQGGILASAQATPKIWVELFHEFEKGKLDVSQQLFLKLLPFIRAVFSEVNPGPLKEALVMMNRSAGSTRKPLLPIREETREKLRQTLKDLEMLSPK